MKKTLICITTCNRLKEVKKYLLPYIDFCNKNKGFDFLLALDGNNQEYIDFCVEYQIPLLYSDIREGVGISKNRVLKQFAKYDFYFFIEDDIELICNKIFANFIKLHYITGYHHFCNNHIKNQQKKEYIEELNINISHSKTGGAQFCFYTITAIYLIGGWHPLFAKYKRYGHTEHSYRVTHAKLQEFPFVFVDEYLNKYLVIHNPPVVTKISICTNEFELIEDEQNLINQKRVFVPITTLSDFYFNDFDMSHNKKIDDFLKKNKRKYPLVKGLDRLKCLSNYSFYKFTNSKTKLVSLFYLLLAAFYYPLNNQIKHLFKQKMGLV